MNIETLEQNHVDSPGKPITQETQNEIRRVLFRIRDFGQVYNICDGTYSMAEANFSINDEFNNVKQVLEVDFKKRNTWFTIIVDPSIP